MKTSRRHAGDYGIIREASPAGRRGKATFRPAKKKAPERTLRSSAQPSGRFTGREDQLRKLIESMMSEFYALYHISKNIGTILDTDQLSRKVSVVLEKTFGCDRVSLYLFEENGARLVLRGGAGPGPGVRVVLGKGEGLPGKIALEGEPLLIGDLVDHYARGGAFLHVPDEAPSAGSYLGIPLKGSSEVLGVLCMSTPMRDGLTMNDLDFLVVLANVIAAGFEKIRLLQDLQQLSRIDDMTGLYNYRTFRQKLSEEVSRRKRTHMPLALLMIDIDHFKAVNDACGHQAGDEVLRQVARLIKDQTRHATIDICCRYGGEEFAVVMPEEELERALLVAERIRAAVAAHEFPAGGYGSSCRLTISVGAAGLSGGDALDADGLIKRADGALYHAKACGRNTVCYSCGGAERYARFVPEGS